MPLVCWRMLCKQQAGHNCGGGPSATCARRPMPPSGTLPIVSNEGAFVEV